MLTDVYCLNLSRSSSSKLSHGIVTQKDITLLTLVRCAKCLSNPGRSDVGHLLTSRLVGSSLGQRSMLDRHNTYGSSQSRQGALV